MEMIFILFLSALITVYPLVKIDNYMMKNKINGSKNKFIRILQMIISSIIAIAWFISSCYIAVGIYKLLESLISSI